MECQCLTQGLWMIETFDGLGVSMKKPRDKLLNSFRVLTILWEIGILSGCAEEGSHDNKEFHPR